MRSITALDSREQFGIYTHFSGGFIPTSDNNNNKNDDDYREEARIVLSFRDARTGEQRQQTNIKSEYHHTQSRSSFNVSVYNTLILYIFSCKAHVTLYQERAPLQYPPLHALYTSLYTLDAVWPNNNNTIIRDKIIKTVLMGICDICFDLGPITIL